MVKLVKESLRPALPFLTSDASFSHCGLYRWSLRRTWDRDKKRMLFVGLNPSKATADACDPTLKRLLRFSDSWGYGDLVVVNLFGRVSASPSLLRNCKDPIGEKNDEELFIQVLRWSENPVFDLWLGWGVQGRIRKRNCEVLGLLKFHCLNREKHFPEAKGPMVIGLTSQGHPRHPLYSPVGESLKPFNWYRSSPCDE